MTAPIGVLPACNTEACGLSRLKNHSALLVRFAPCDQHLAHKTRWRDRGFWPGLRQRSMALVVRALFHWPSGNRAKVKSQSPASSRLSAAALHLAAICG
jgi:hypothetical protein